MFKRAIGIFVSLFLCLTISSQAQQNEKTLSLSLEDCILKAMKNNLGVAIDVLDPELADISVALSQEKFLPQLSLFYNKSNTSSASYSWIEAAKESISENMTYSAEVSQQIPSGGSFTMRLSGNKYDTNRQFQTINPRYGSTLRFNFNQPLLKNFGFNINRKEIIVAKNNRDISEINFKKALQDTIYSVEDAYWNLVYSIEILKVRKQSFDLAQDLLEKNKRAVEVGTMAPIEILNAQSEVATREADILDAEATVKNNEDILKTIINLAEEEELELVKIIPKDKPEYEKKEVNLDEALLIAMNNRPDLQASRVDLKNKEINLSYTRNQLLPDLSLNASYWSPGVSGDQIVYKDGNVLSGIVVGTIPGGASDALKDALGLKYNNWTVGLTLDIPLNSFLSRAAHAQARVNLQQTMLQIKNQEQQIFLEIKQTVRAVQTNFKRVQAYKIARELNERKLEAEQERLKVGLSTNYWVLQYQRDLALSQTTELRALIDYNLSLASLNNALGISLKEKNISTTEILRR